MNLVELGERRKEFVKACVAEGMSYRAATSEENWKRFTYFCNTGELLDNNDPPLGVRPSSNATLKAEA